MASCSLQNKISDNLSIVFPPSEVTHIAKELIKKNPSLVIENELLDIVVDPQQPLEKEDLVNLVQNTNLFESNIAVELIGGQISPIIPGLQREAVISVGMVDAKGVYNANVATTDVYNAYVDTANESSTLSGNIVPKTEVKLDMEIVNKELKTLLSVLGISVNAVPGIEGNALGAADLVNKSIRLALDKIHANEIDEILAEEIAHIYLSMINSNDVLKSAMIKNIHKFPEYQEVKTTYKDVYTTEEQFMEEAMGKVMAKVIMDKLNGASTTHQVAQSWLDMVIKWVKSIFNRNIESINKFETLLSPYKRLNAELFSGNPLRLTETSSGILYKLSKDAAKMNDIVKGIQNEAVTRGITVQTSTGSIDTDELEPISNYVGIDGKVYNRVTNLSSEGNKYKFKTVNERTAELLDQLNNNYITKEQFEREKFKIHYSADIGTIHHKLMELFIANYNPVSISETNRAVMEDMLKTKWFKDVSESEAKILIKKLLDSEVFLSIALFAKTRIDNGSVLYTETTIMDDAVKVAGTVDIIEVTKNGTVNILDLKTMMSGASMYSQDKRQGWSKQLSLYSRILERNNEELDIDSLFIIPVVLHLNQATVKNTIENTSDTWNIGKIEALVNTITQDSVQNPPNISGRKSPLTSNTLAVEYNRTFVERKLPLQGTEVRRNRQIKSFTGTVHLDEMAAVLKNNIQLLNTQIKNRFNEQDVTTLRALVKTYAEELERITRASMGSEMLEILESEITFASTLINEAKKTGDLTTEFRTRLQDASNRLGRLQKWLEDASEDPDFINSMGPVLSTSTYKSFSTDALRIYINNQLKQAQSVNNLIAKIRIDDGLKKTVETYKGKFTEEELTSARPDQGSMTTWLASLSRSPDPIAQYVGVVLQDIEHNRNVDFKKERDELQELIKNLQKEFPGIKGKDLYDFMLESEIVDGQKVYTGNIVKQYKSEYYKLKYKLKGDKQAEFIKDNEIYIPPNIANNIMVSMATSGSTKYTPPTYLEIFNASTAEERLMLEQEFNFTFSDVIAREKAGEAVELEAELNELIEESLARYEEYKEELDVATKLGDLNKQTVLNVHRYITSVYKKGIALSDSQGYRFVVSKPKNSKNWHSDKYNDLQGDIAKKAVYDKVVNILKEGRSILPVVKEGKFVKSKYYLPELQESVSERMDRRGFFGLFDGGKRALAGILGTTAEGIEYEPAVSYDGTTIPNLPVYMFNTGMKERSFDVGKVMEAFLFNVYQYKHAQEAEPLINNLLETIGSIKYQGSKLQTRLGNYIGSMLGTSSNVFKHTKNTRDTLLYGERRVAKNPSTISLGRYRLADGREQELFLSGGTILDSLRTLTVWTGMALAPFSAFANLAIGVVNNVIFSGEQREYGFSDLVIGWKRFFSPGDRNKLFKVMAALNLDLNMEDITFAGTSVLSTSENKWVERIRALPFAMHRGGENFNYATLVAAALEKNGVWDRIEIKDGKVILPDDFDSRKFEYIVNEIHRNAHGEYSTAHPMMVKKYAIGRAAMLFRTFLPQLIAEFTRKDYYSLVREKDVKGRFLSMWDFTKAIYDNYGLTPNKLELASNSWKSIAEVDRANIRKMMYHLAALSIFVLASSMLDLTSALGWEDDDQEDRRKKLKKANRGAYFAAHNSLGRVIKDLQFFMDADAAMSLTTFPITNTIGNLADILSSAMETMQGKGTYERGMYKGESKLIKDIIIATPIVNQARTTWVKYTSQDLTKSYKR